MKIPLYNKYIGGNNAFILNNTILKNYNKHKWFPIVFHARERCKTEKGVKNSMSTIKDTVKILSANTIPTSYALKYSSFNSFDKLNYIINEMLKKCNTKFIFIDSEHNSEYNNEKEITDKLIKKHNSSKIFKTYQMYRKDNLHEIKRDLLKYNSFGIKLVRGAYYDKYDKNMYKTIEETHEAYNKALLIILNSMKYNKNINLLVATHNQVSLNIVIDEIKDEKKLRKRVYFGQLMGMSDSFSNYLVKNNYQVMKYVPYGTLYETIPYLLRRLYENKYLVKYFF